MCQKPMMGFPHTMCGKATMWHASRAHGGFPTMVGFPPCGMCHLPMMGFPHTMMGFPHTMMVVLRSSFFLLPSSVFLLPSSFFLLPSSSSSSSSSSFSSSSYLKSVVEKTSILVVDPTSSSSSFAFLVFVLNSWGIAIIRSHRAFTFRGSLIAGALPSVDRNGHSLFAVS